MNRNDYYDFSGHTEFYTEFKEVDREGVIGKHLDVLLGKKKKPVINTRYESNLNAHTLKIIDVIEEEKASIEQKQNQDLKRKMENA